MKDAQPFKFVINRPVGSQITGGCETKQLAIDHLRHVAKCYPGSICWYTGKGGTLTRPRRIR